MFRIRQVWDSKSSGNAAALVQVEQLLRQWFPLVSVDEFAALPSRIDDRLRRGFRTLLYVAQDANERVRGCAVLLHDPELRFDFLDYIAAAPTKAGGGVGGALYQRIREEAIAHGSIGLFFECLPDDPLLSRNETVRLINADRLRFYETFGARPIANTAYESPLKPGYDNPPYLVLDPLGQSTLPGRDAACAIVAAILERKYRKIMPPNYATRVIASFHDDPIRLRPPRYGRRDESRPVRPQRSLAERMPLVVNDRHDIHHVRERGYVEAPVRVKIITQELDRLALFERVEPLRFADTWIYAVHDRDFVDYLRAACASLEPGRSVYPYVFPIRNQSRPPKDLPLRAGYFCIDTFTPLNRNAYPAARRAVDCALTAALRVLEGQRLAYALVRPPGHHAERRAFGGFCYFNNTAIAANYLSRFGRVAVFDIDYHHGNGTQEIFYARDDVLTVSIHGHPRFAYPYFTGFRDERGAGAGKHFNLNIPLPEALSTDDYRRAVTAGLARIRRFGPRFLVVAVGFDTAKGDPTGSWQNGAADFERIGALIGAAGFPTVVVQEGGYRTRTLGRNAAHFFSGLLREQRAERPPRVGGPA
jgi:acetoin utilization deacetylase AcuC-like enzyme/GNAT superfamily N-acetyltransferase